MNDFDKHLGMDRALTRSDSSKGAARDRKPCVGCAKSAMNRNLFGLSFWIMLGAAALLFLLIPMLASIFTAALLAEGLEDLELEHIFPNISATIVGSFPGLRRSSIVHWCTDQYLEGRVLSAKNLDPARDASIEVV